MKFAATKPRSNGKVARGVTPRSQVFAGAEDRLNRIVAVAYYKAKEREFMTRQELEDWLEEEVGTEEQAKH